MRMGLVIAAALGASSCISLPGVVYPFTAPDGRQAYLVKCGGGLRDLTSCFEAARKQCGGNYTELNRSITPYEIGNGSSENRQIEIVCATS